VTLHVIVHSIGCVNPRVLFGKTVSSENERHVQSTVKILEEPDQFLPILLLAARDSGAEESNSQLSVGTSSFGDVK
jgi:hypothetical protein